MAIYPYTFSSDSSLGPKSKKRGGSKMACKSKKATSTKKKSSKKKPC